MKILKIFSVLMILTLSTPAFAAQTVTVGVNGMVCDFCARALEKVFSKREEVSSINVNLDDKTVVVNIVDGADISDEELSKLINDSGYDVRTITRTDTKEVEDGSAS